MAALPPMPAELKKIKGYLMRANEMNRVGTSQALVVSYHCKKYAAELATEIHKTTGSGPDGLPFIMALLDQLEASKVKVEATNLSEDERHAICSDIALRIFKKADDVDRAGMADKSTAQTFYKASGVCEFGGAGWQRGRRRRRWRRWPRKPQG